MAEKIKMKGKYCVLKWDSSHEIVLLADEVHENVGAKKLTFKLDGKVIGEFRSYDGWWLKGHRDR
ncbi:MAG: hypothetical protein OXF23_02685 [Candidatus Dadabacteria bacterium]|nr:hypothetical protein [Candidatus Dadabacteria bacterium]